MPTTKTIEGTFIINGKIEIAHPEKPNDQIILEVNEDDGELKIISSNDTISLISKMRELESRIEALETT